MLTAAGLSVEGRFGGYTGGPLHRGAPRTILLSRLIA
jgi:hypothetical protein